MEFVYNTERNNIQTFEQLILSRYPDQNDPEYWNKVPELFKEYFSTREAVQQFKNCPLVYRVPIYVDKNTEQLSYAYLNDLRNMLLSNQDYAKEILPLFNEPTTGWANKDRKSWFTFSVSSTGEHKINGELSTSYFIPIKLHNIVKFEKETAKNIADYDCIIEIGGGCGELARLIHARGFKGDYYDVDFEPMCKIAQYYNEPNVVIGVNNIKQIDVKKYKDKKVLLVGTHSFSETPFDYRMEIINHLVELDMDWLIAFQVLFTNQNLDNLNWFIDPNFRQWTNTEIKMYNIPWHDHQGGNLYMFGINKN